MENKQEVVLSEWDASEFKCKACRQPMSRHPGHETLCKQNQQMVGALLKILSILRDSTQARRLSDARLIQKVASDTLVGKWHG